MIRPLLAALSIAAFGCIAATAEDQLTDETVVGAMCRPHRPAHVAYGGLTPMPGYQRDHWIPLCLGGPDARDANENPMAPPRLGNVWYEPWPEWKEKDKADDRACRLICHAGPAAIEKAREDFRLGNWRKWLETPQ